MQRAYSILEIKSYDNERRIIEGVATTPSPDRVNDVVVTEGVEFKLPLPLLYQHNSSKPIGNVVEARASKDGIRIVAKIAPEGVAAFIDEAWALIKNGLVRGLSIGFRSLEDEFDKQLNGYRFLRTELLELSAVTIPANAEASILSVKSADREALAASGRSRREPVRLDRSLHSPGVSGQRQGKSMKTIGEQISAFEAKRAAHAARMTQLMDRAGDEGRTLDETEVEEYDGLKGEVGNLDEHLARLRAHEKQVIRTDADKATAVTAGDSESASKARGGAVRVRSQELPKGTAFTRYVMAMARSRGNTMQALEIARQQGWRETTPEVERALKGIVSRGGDGMESILREKVAVDYGDTTTSGWASQLADYTYMASEFIELLRPQTILGKIPTGPNGLRRVPFNIKMPTQTHGFGSANWVGEGVAKPLGRMTFSTATLRWAKVAGIVVLTDELVRFSNPSAEALVRADLAAAIAQFLDEQFIDPDVAAVANVSPASITNGAGTSVATGVDADDLRWDFRVALRTLIAANIAPQGGVFVMQPIQGLAIGLMMNALGQPEFTGINADGGNLLGYQVITSNSCPEGTVVFFVPREIMVADDGGVSIDASREATVLMDDGVSPATETTVNLWQQNLVAIRAERYINWARRRLQAVHYITGCSYGNAHSP
jgi:HK97 family phage major capsid protein/HK97 family phage prohead protease